MGALLDIAGLSVDLGRGDNALRGIEKIDLAIAAGETVCLVGESGSGKTVTALSVMRLIDFKGGVLTEGAIRLDGRNLAELSQRQMTDLRGRQMGIIFQEPMTAFDPIFSIGHQIAEVVEVAPTGTLFARAAHPYTRGLLQSVVGLAMPRGEPLPAIRGAIPNLAQPPDGCRFHPRCPRSSAVCQREAPELRPRHPGHVACWHPFEDGIAATVEAVPGMADVVGARRPLLIVSDLHKHYRTGTALLAGQHRVVRAVDGVSFQIEEGETFGLVGESGCCKSTLARVLSQLEPATAGGVTFAGADLGRLGHAGLRRMRRHMQMIFQDPCGSIDPRWTLGQIIAEPLVVHDGLRRSDRRARVGELLQQVGLDPAWQDRHPHALSAGQRQRVAIARAIALHPRFIVADEAVSALDVSVQAQVVNLLQDLKQRLGLTYLFIGHGLNLVRHVSDRIGVMYLGRMVEVGSAEEVFRQPAHPYTRALLAAIPVPDPTRRGTVTPLPGEIPSPANPPSGCRFHTRCSLATSRCRNNEPALVPHTGTRSVACHFPL